MFENLILVLVLILMILILINLILVALVLTILILVSLILAILVLTRFSLILGSFQSLSYPIFSSRLHPISLDILLILVLFSKGSDGLYRA